MRWIVTALLASAVAVAGSVRTASAQDYFGDDAPDDKIQFRTDIPRTTEQRIVIASLFGGAALFGGLGLLFHLDSRSKSDEVSAAGEHTGLIYDPSLEDTRKGALRSRTLAIVGYSLGGALVIAGAVALYLTEPGTRVVTVGEEKDEPKPANPVPVSIVPIEGGAMVGGSWSF
jgi:hypothetical protein